MNKRAPHEYFEMFHHSPGRCGALSIATIVLLSLTLGGTPRRG